jgi:hypothetical protein
MRLVLEAPGGTVELNWIWLPTWLGHNTRFKESVEQHMSDWIIEHRSIGATKITDDLLDVMHKEVISHIVDMFPGIPGLDKYLEAIQYVGDGS